MKDLLSFYNPDKINFFRFKMLGGKYLITNDIGAYCLMSENNFKKFISGKLNVNSKLYKDLLANFFIKTPEEDSNNTDCKEKHILPFQARFLQKNSFLFSGPSLHIVVLTRRCNLSCLYCHASAENAADTDMTKETAAKVLNIIFSSPSETLSIEFQGGEPLLNWPVLVFMVNEVVKMASEKGKKLILSVVTNMSAMTKDKLKFLFENSVRICTSLDGPKSLHNKNRCSSAGNIDSHSYVTKWIKKIMKGSRDSSAADALLTVTRYSLPKWKQIIDEYIKLGFGYIFIRFLNPYGAAKKHWNDIGYTADEYLEYYKKSLNYIIKLNLEKKASIFENTARILLKKIFAEDDPNFLDLRSPCGAVIGQIAYNYDGNIYTCDEGRMLANSGDDTFFIGDTKNNSYEQIINSEVSRAMVTASINDIHPLCSVCAYKPYCGVCPIFNYSEHKDMFVRPSNYRCKIYSGILDYLFTRMEDKKVKKLFKSWGSIKKDRTGDSL